MRILLVEDEAPAARMLAKRLREHTYAVDVANNGEEALYLAGINDYDLIILNIMLPKKDGFAVCRELRAQGLMVPVLMLTARDAVRNRITGLDVAADDYLTKSFDFYELLARVRALLRRGQVLHADILTVADLEVDPHGHKLKLIRALRGAGYRLAAAAEQEASE